LCRTGADIVTVNPSRVYGPGILSDSNGLRDDPPVQDGEVEDHSGDGSSIGNYVYLTMW
jgi:farnesol dehydrogenase